VAHIAAAAETPLEGDPRLFPSRKRRPGIWSVATNLPGMVAVRDSKDPDGPQLIVSASGWQMFAAGIRAGRFRL